MKKQLDKKKFITQLIITIIICICIYGCSDNVDFDWSDYRSDRNIAAFIDDSFVVVTDTRRWIETTEKWNGAYKDKDGCGNDRMCIYNYRVQEDGPRWCDSTTSESGSYKWFQLTDSVIWAGSPWDGAGSFIKLWKIGEKDPIKHELRTKKIGCTKTFMPNSYKPWLDGTFIGKNEESFKTGGDTCQYVVLDTIANTITYKRLDENIDWIQKCDDVRAWGDDVYCLLLEEEGNSVVLKNSNDSIFVPLEKIYEGNFSGNMMELGVRICSLVTDKIACSDVKWTGNRDLEFYRNDGTIIHLN